MAFKAHTNRNIQMKGNFYTTTLFFSFKNAQVLLKNSPSSIAKCNRAGREKNQSHILEVLLDHSYLDTCKYINNWLFFSYEYPAFQEDAKQPNTRNLSLFQIWFKKKWLNGMAGWSSQSLKTALDLFLRIHSFSLPLEMNLKLPKVGGYSEPGWRDKRGKDRLQF